jgi:hypothetical protein
MADNWSANAERDYKPRERRAVGRPKKRRREIRWCSKRAKTGLVLVVDDDGNEDHVDDLQSNITNQKLVLYM